MGGKTNILKLVAQICELTRYAIPIPATTAQVPVYDFIYYNHTQESDSLSSFGAEVVAFCTALKHKGKGCSCWMKSPKVQIPPKVKPSPRRSSNISPRPIIPAFLPRISLLRHASGYPPYRIAGIPKDFKLSRAESGERVKA